jgi:hypothetical protein
MPGVTGGQTPQRGLKAHPLAGEPDGLHSTWM